MYNIRYDPELEVSKATVRTIPCVCSFFLEQLYLPWDKNRNETQVKKGMV